MTNNAFATLLVLAAIPTGMASGVLGVWMVRAFLGWFLQSGGE